MSYYNSQQQYQYQYQHQQTYSAPTLSPTSILVPLCLILLFSYSYFLPHFRLTQYIELIMNSRPKPFKMMELRGLDWNLGEEEEVDVGVIEGLKEAYEKGEKEDSEGLYLPGLANAVGNLCFLNATLQSMASLPSLLTFLHSLHTFHLSLLPPSSSSFAPQPPPIPITHSLLSLLYTLSTPTPTSKTLRPLALVNALANSSERRRSLLGSREQQDAHELWGMIREGWEEELGKVRMWARERERRERVGLGGILGEIGKGKGKERLREPHEMMISQRVKCLICGYVRDVRHEMEAQVGLVVPNFQSSGVPLLSLLSEFSKPDLISDYSCRKCSVLATVSKITAQLARLEEEREEEEGISKSRKERAKKVRKSLKALEKVVEEGDFERDIGEAGGGVLKGVKLERVGGNAGKKVGFGRTPQILTIHLSRSASYSSSGAIYKNSTHVSFPLSLDLSPYTDHPSPSSDHYELRSLVVHYGTHHFGHYVAYRKLGNRWWRVSDESVEESSEEYVGRANPFLLFYEKRNVGEGREDEVRPSPRVVERWGAMNGFGKGKEKEVEVETETETETEEEVEH